MTPHAWAEDCAKWRGRFLMGAASHWCFDWDDLPIDETCYEWPCACASELRSQKPRDATGNTPTMERVPEGRWQA